MLSGFFFLQAEDGIRDLVRSRGLGDVYKRQALDIPRFGWVNLHFSLLPAWRGAAPVQHAIRSGAVSYTHMTLPTNYPV